MDFKLKKKVLSSGLTILFEKRNVPVVSVAYALRAGGINESLNEKGISHFIEHMVYKGTSKRDNKKIAEEIELNGGEMNGFTSEEITAYWCKMPSSKLSVALDVLTDIVKNPKFDEKELEKERKVIFEEIKMRRDMPHVYVLDEIQKCLYSGSLSVDLIGTEKTMNPITREKIIDKFNSLYKPSNLVLVVVGNADFNEVVKFAEENFSNEKSEIPEQEINLRNQSKKEKRAGLDQSSLVFAYYVPLKDYSARVLSALTSEGMSSRLFSEIREKRNLAYAVKGDSDINKRYAYNFIYVGTSKDNVEQVKELILKEFEKISKNLDEKEFNQFKDKLIGNYKISMEDSQDQLFNLIVSEIQSSAEEFYEFEKKIKEVKIEDVQKLAKSALDKHSFFVLVPE